MDYRRLAILIAIVVGIPLLVFLKYGVVWGIVAFVVAFAGVITFSSLIVASEADKSAASSRSGSEERM